MNIRICMPYTEVHDLRGREGAAKRHRQKQLSGVCEKHHAGDGGR